MRPVGKSLQLVTPDGWLHHTSGEWKPIHAFSEKQQRLVHRQVDAREKVDAANSGMVCMEHSAAFRAELRCDLCGLNKPYDQFSKNMRKSDAPVSRAWSCVELEPMD
ncbi:hypothetical protein UVI_02060070 [Ustilaginoidea virens]|uniref:Stc1 domain-containing protein n=1 Tax=Ustilaginoidea virens TaxID=1159556 RepID=A0A1B5L3J5_USTVR|nr:hypothetical protein UVI_02060070 [Ustilaginoidea virens]